MQLCMQLGAKQYISAQKMERRNKIILLWDFQSANNKKYE